LVRCLVIQLLISAMAYGFVPAILPIGEAPAAYEKESFLSNKMIDEG
jgi:hypothetical protein